MKQILVAKYMFKIIKKKFNFEHFPAKIEINVSSYTQKHVQIYQ